jgi:Cu+-exporting ATPase
MSSEATRVAAQTKPHIDPVCGMKVAANPEKAVEFAGTTYYFCSQGCASKFKADKLLGATLNTNGSLVMRAEQVGSQTVLAQIVQMVAQAQRSKAPMQRMADKVAGYFVVAVVSVALLTFFAWGVFGPQPNWVYGLINAVAVLIIACPCALGLATPMSIMVATGKAATLGVLFRDAAAIEQLCKVNTLIVDKTGT